MATATKSAAAVTAFEKVKSTAEKNRRGDDPQRVGALGLTDEVRQGDVYFIKLDKVPAGATLQNPLVPKLVPGDTQGSQHVVTGATLGNCRLYTPANPTELDGPVLEVLKAPVEVGHPEHGNVIFESPGVYDVKYQRTRADELRRVRD